MNLVTSVVFKLVATFTVAFAIVTAAAPASEAASHGFTSSEQVYLEFQAKAALMSDQINAAHVHSLKLCACYLLEKSGDRFAQCPQSDGKPPKFIRSIINSFGEKVSREVTCEKIIENLIYRRLEMRWSEVHVAMALMEPQQVSINEGSEYLSETETFGFGETSADRFHVPYKISTQVDHAIKKLPWQDRIVVAPATRLTRDEYAEAMNTYRDWGFKRCVDIFKRTYGVNSCPVNVFKPPFDGAAYNRLSPSQGSQYLTATYERTCDELLFNQNAHETRAQFSSILKQLARERVAVFRKEHRENYQQWVQENPLLVMLPSARPTHRELVTALTIIDSGAQKRLRKSMEQSQPGKDLSPFAERLDVSVYSTIFWEKSGRSPSEYNVFAAQAAKRIAAEQSRRAWVEMGSIVALNTACLLPWGKGIGVYLRVLKLSCLAGFGIPLNTWFLMDSLGSYSDAITRLQSSVETQQSLEVAMKEYDSERLGLALSTILFPLGMQLIEAKQAISLLRSL